MSKKKPRPRPKPPTYLKVASGLKACGVSVQHNRRVEVVS